MMCLMIVYFYQRLARVGSELGLLSSQISQCQLREGFNKMLYLEKCAFIAA
jgi:hypothetical protein